MRTEAVVLPLRPPPGPQVPSFKAATRLIPHGVGLLTISSGGRPFAYTTSGVTRLGIEPPRLLACVEAGSGPGLVRLAAGDKFGLSILAGEQREFADRFAGGGAVDTEAGGPASPWCMSGGAAPTLRDAVARFRCDVEDVIERGPCTLLLGRVRDVHASAAASALVAWRGDYDHLGWSDAEIARATGCTPCG